jgi:hypothetical protein
MTPEQEEAYVGMRISCLYSGRSQCRAGR